MIVAMSGASPPICFASGKPAGDVGQVAKITAIVVISAETPAYRHTSQVTIGKTTILRACARQGNSMAMPLSMQSRLRCLDRRP